MRIVGLLIIGLAMPGVALAQATLPSAGVDRLVLVPGSGPVVGGDATTLEGGRFRIALAAHYERSPLLLATTDAAGNRAINEVIGHRVQAHLLIAIGVLDWLDIQLQAPLTVFQTGADLSNLGLARPQSFGVGSPVIGLRAGILSQKRGGPFDLALQLGVALPLGTPGALTGGRLAALPSLHIGRSFGILHLAASVGGAIESQLAVGSQRVGSNIEVNGLVGLGEGLRAELISRNVFSVAGAPHTAELLIGGRALSLEPFDFFLHGGPTFGDAPGAPAFRIIGGIGVGNAYAKPKPVDPCTQPTHTPAQCPLLDDDKDGVANGTDQCPLEPEDLDGFNDTDGCVDADNDGDGIVDSQDKCRDVAGVAAYEGCPVPDADKDGVLDADDKCPNEAGPASRQGCPFRDADSDGVEDSVDACPTEAGLVELRGCPAKDRDGDEVADHLDNCPDEKGVKENQGCPKKKKQLVVITAERLVIKDKVYFATGKSTILAKSFPLLDQVAEVIQGHPELKSVVVEGHTDSVGKAETNRKLSQDRANSVRAYLIKKGVAAERLAARGYGPDRPAAENSTAAGREQNRRVEFILPSTEKEGGTP